MHHNVAVLARATALAARCMHMYIVCVCVCLVCVCVRACVRVRAYLRAGNTTTKSASRAARSFVLAPHVCGP